jgi:hypothetical protein
VTVFKYLTVVIPVNAFNQFQVWRELNKGQVGVVELDNDIIPKTVFEVFLTRSGDDARGFVHTFGVPAALGAQVVVLLDGLVRFPQVFFQGGSVIG